MTGMMIGVLLGGWVAERTDRHLDFVVATTMIGAGVLLCVDIVAMAQLMTIAMPQGRPQAEAHRSADRACAQAARRQERDDQKCRRGLRREPGDDLQSARTKRVW